MSIAIASRRRPASRSASRWCCRLAQSSKPVLKLTDVAGGVLAECTSGVLGYTCPRAGTYALALRDREYRGDGMKYRLHLGSVPVVMALFPLGLQRGTETAIHLDGVNLGGVDSAARQGCGGYSTGQPLAVVGADAQRYSSRQPECRRRRVPRGDKDCGRAGSVSDRRKYSGR